MGSVEPKLLANMQSAESSGPMMRPRRGGVDEFYGLKEYRQGENPRYIYWKRSARTGTMVLTEMTHVSPPRVMLLVDTFVEGWRSREPIDRAASRNAWRWPPRWPAMPLSKIFPSACSFGPTDGPPSPPIAASANV